jgi:hypothetical protein
MPELITHTMKSAPRITLNADIFSIDQIPAAMDNMGWKVAPQLMRHWFSGKPAKGFNEDDKDAYMKKSALNIPLRHVNDSIVKMEWALRYKPVQKGFVKLKADWASEKGKIELRKQLVKNNGILRHYRDVREIDTLTVVNTTKIGDYLWGFGETIDDYFGAIGKANLKVAPQGYQDKFQGKDVFITETIGFYIKDSYDFLGDEFLGIWNKKGILSKKQALLYMNAYELKKWKLLYDMGMQWTVPVYNKDFREWQRIRNTGIDFIVFSDILWIPPLSKHRIIEL